jgi:hypothetical protein
MQLVEMRVPGVHLGAAHGLDHNIGQVNGTPSLFAMPRPAIYLCGNALGTF